MKAVQFWTVLAIASVCFGQGRQIPSQTAAPGSSQTFDRAGVTRPMKVGTTLPSICTVGDQFFKSNATAGQNLYACTSANTWTQQAGGGGGGAGLPAPVVVNTSGTVATVGTACATTTCIVIVNNLPYFFTTASTLTCSAGTNTGLIYYMVDETANIHANFPLGMTCTPAGMTASAQASPGYDANSGPLATQVLTGGVMGAVTAAVGAMTVEVKIAGDGIGVANGVISVDATVARPGGTNVWTGANDFTACSPCTGLGGGTERQSFMLVWKNSAVGQAPGTLDSNGSATFSTALTGPGTGPNYNVGGIQLTGTQFFLVGKMTSSTWSGAAGTIDLAIAAYQQDGVPSAGNWNFNFFVGCEASNAAPTWGTVSTATGTPPSTALTTATKTYGVTGINIPASCAAGRPIFFFVQRAADSGGTTGVVPIVTLLDSTIRGN